MRLLIVDDEKNIRELYAADLEDAGYQVDTAADAAQVADLLQKHRFDLVVLDIHMGNECGLDILQDIIRERKDLPVVLCSAYSCYKEDFSSWLADGYVVKSSDTAALRDEIEKVLAKRGGTSGKGQA